MKTQTRPQNTPQEQARVNQIYKSLPDSYKKLGMAGERAIDRLLAKGVSFKEAENMVIIVLKESEPYLKKGMIGLTIASLEMIF